MDAPAGIIQVEGHTGFLHLPSALLALIFLARRIQPSLSLVDSEVETRTYSVYGAKSAEGEKTSTTTRY